MQLIRPERIKQSLKPENASTEAPLKVERGESPRYMRMSLAAAMTLGFERGRFFRDSCLHCLNLLLTYDTGCHANCAYCGLARDRQEDYVEKSFIRVEWPLAETSEIVRRAGERGDVLERMCISMVTHPRAEEDTLEVLESWTREPGVREIPVSILSNPTTMRREDLVTMKRLGAERFTVAIDAATETLFEETRGKGVKGPNRWDKYWGTLEEAGPIFGKDKIGAHLICGMGETERELAFAMQRVQDLGTSGSIHLFGFNPEEGSRMVTRRRVPLGQFRRMQVARFLMDKDISRVERMGFDDLGRLIDFGVRADILDQVVESGLPFRTSGCPGKTPDVSACNRPFGDGPPRDFRSYPFALSISDVSKMRKQMLDYAEQIETNLSEEEIEGEAEQYAMDRTGCLRSE